MLMVALIVDLLQTGLDLELSGKEYQRVLIFLVAACLEALQKLVENRAD